MVSIDHKYHFNEIHTMKWLTRRFEDLQHPGGRPTMQNDEGVLLGPYSQKTFLKGTNFRIVYKKLDANHKNWPRF